MVVPTFRRREPLQRALDALSAQSASFEWDVVVVDNDPAGSAAEVCREAAARGLPVTYVVEETNGAAHARNRGIKQATGETIALLDDDVVPQPDWLAAICAPVQRGDAVAAGGRVRLEADVVRPDWFDEAGLGGYLSSFDLGDRPVEIGERDYLLTANFAASARSLAEVGGFDPTFGPRRGVQLVADDAHLVRQLCRRGGAVVYVPDAVVVHELPPERLNRKYLLRRAYLQGRSDWMLDRLDHQDRRFGGFRVALTLVSQWLTRELGKRRHEGLTKRAVRFHALCDVVRFVGTIREAASPSAARRRDRAPRPGAG